MDSTDPRFTEITDLSAAQDFATVARRVDALVQEGVYDIRIIVFALYDNFLTEGVTGLAAVCACLRALVGENLAAIGPSSRREQHVDKSVGWLCRTVSERLEYHSSKQDGTWHAYQSLPLPMLQQSLQAAQDLAEQLQRTELRGAADCASNLVRWLSELKRAACTQPGRDGAKDNAKLQATDEERSHRADFPGPRGTLTGTGAGLMNQVNQLHGLEAEPIVLRGSYPLRELIFKLAAFESLIDKGRFDRAAVLGDEIETQLEHFDPRVYLPELFSTFGRLHAEFFVQLEGQREHRDSTRWRAYQQFYRVDPVGFVEAE